MVAIHGKTLLVLHRSINKNRYREAAINCCKVEQVACLCYNIDKTLNFTAAYTTRIHQSINTELFSCDYERERAYPEVNHHQNEDHLQDRQFNSY